ncbi:hypothetical protein X975_06832, partial [Stegodyphus mimosarum]
MQLTRCNVKYNRFSYNSYQFFGTRYRMLKTSLTTTEYKPQTL